MLVCVAGSVAGAIGHFATSAANADALCFLTAGILLGELLVLRLEDESAIPLSYAVLVVLASSFSFPQYAAAVVVAEVLALPLRTTDRGVKASAVVTLERLVVAAATFGAYRAAWNAVNNKETVPAVLAALGAAALAQVVVDVAFRSVLRIGASFSQRARLVWLAIASSGMLMAIGYRGVHDAGRVGIWGPLLFSTPLLAAWYAFERLDSATRSYRQTIEALALAPELGRLVPAGHAHRVAALAGAMGEHLGLPTADIRDLEMAALLHHLGQVTLDEPEDPTKGANPQEVAAVTSAMMREIRPLAAAGDIVGGETDDPKRRLAAQVLRLASEYDDLTAQEHMGSDQAIEWLRSTPAFVYDARVFVALERVSRAHVSTANE